MDTLFLQQQPLPKNSLLTFLGRSHAPGEGTWGKALSFKQNAEPSCSTVLPWWAEGLVRTLCWVVVLGRRQSPCVGRWLSCPRPLRSQSACTQGPGALPPLHCHMSRDARPQPRKRGRRRVFKQSAGQLPAAQGPSQGWGHGLATAVPTWLAVVGGWGGGIGEVGDLIFFPGLLLSGLLCTSSRCLIS